MKIYYSSSEISSNPQLNSIVMRDIPQYIRLLGHNVHENFYNPDRIESDQDFTEIASEISGSDVFIGEMSNASQTLGFQLAYALNQGKPCLYIYNANRRGEPDLIISKHPSRLLRLSTYKSTEDAHKELQKFLKTASTQMNTSRTSFISTQRIDEYVNIASATLKTSKGEIIRQLLDDAINTNRLSIK